MSNAPDEEFETEAEQPKRNFRRELEDRAVAAEQKAQQLQRENAIYKAGLTSLTERQINVLASQIEGDPSIDQVKALAAELGWSKPSEEKGVPQEEMQQLEQVNAAASGAPSPGADPFSVLDGIDDPNEFWKVAEQNGLTTS